MELNASDSDEAEESTDAEIKWKSQARNKMKTPDEVRMEGWMVQCVLLSLTCFCFPLERRCENLEPASKAVTGSKAFSV